MLGVVDSFGVDLRSPMLLMMMMMMIMMLLLMTAVILVTILNFGPGVAGSRGGIGPGSSKTPWSFGGAAKQPAQLPAKLCSCGAVQVEVD